MHFECHDTFTHRLNPLRFLEFNASRLNSRLTAFQAHQFFTSARIHWSGLKWRKWTDTKRIHARALFKMLVLKYLFQQIAKYLDLRGVCVCVCVILYKSSILVIHLFLWRRRKYDDFYSADTRLQHLPFTSIESVIVIITLYLLFVLKWGPKFMEKRRAYNITYTLLSYNALQIVANSCILIYVNINKIFKLQSSIWEYFAYKSF